MSDVQMQDSVNGTTEMKEPLLEEAGSVGHGILRQYCTWRNAALVLLVLLQVVLGSAERVCFATMASSIPNHAVFLHQLLAGIHVGLFFVCALLRDQCTDGAAEQLLNFSKCSLLGMATLDAAHSMLSLFGAGKVDGIQQTIYIQAMIPLGIVASTVGMQLRFSRMQQLGGAVILAAIFIEFIPQLLQSLGSAASTLRLISFVVSPIPAAISTVAKKNAFHFQAVDPLYFNCWVSFFQLLVGLLLGPLVLHFLQGVPFAETYAHLGTGWMCFWQGVPDEYGEQCQHAKQMVLIFLVVNLLLHIVSMALVQFAGIPAMYLATALVVPAAEFVFTQSAFMDALHHKAETLHPWPDGIAILLILLGLALYQGVAKRVGVRMQTGLVEEGDRELRV